MGKRKKTSNEPPKGLPPAQQDAVDLTLAKPEGLPMMTSDSTGNTAQLVALANSSISLAIGASSSQDSSTIMPSVTDLPTKSSAPVSSNITSNTLPAENPPPVSSAQLLHKDVQASSKNQDDITTQKSATKENSGQSSMTESTLKKDETWPQKPKDPSTVPEVSNSKDEISNRTTVSEVKAPENPLHPAVIVENKSDTGNESSRLDHKVMESVPQNNTTTGTTYQATISVSQKTEKLEPGNSTNLLQTKNSKEGLTVSKNSTETKNLPPSEASPKDQAPKMNLSSNVSEKESPTLPQMSKPNPISSDNLNVNKASEENNQKCPLANVKNVEMEAPVSTSTDKSSVLSRNEKPLENASTKNATDSKLQSSQQKQSKADKTGLSTEAPEMQKSSVLQEKSQPQISPEKKDNENKSPQPIDSKIDIITGKADATNTVSEIKTPQPPTRNVPTPSESLPFLTSPKNDTEIKNLDDENDKTKSQNKNSLNSNVPSQKQIVPNEQVATVEASENKTSTPIQKQMYTELAVGLSMTGSGTFSEICKLPPVTVKSPEKELIIQTTSQSISKEGITPEKMCSPSTASVMAKVENQTSATEKSGVQIKNEETALITKPLGNKSEAKVEEPPQFATCHKEENASHLSVASDSPIKTIKSEGTMEATKKDAMKNEPSTLKPIDKKGNNLEQKSEKNNVTGKTEIKSNTETTISAPDRNPGKKTSKKEAQSTKKGVSESAKKLDDSSSKKIGTSMSVTDVTVNDNIQHDNKDKENSTGITNTQAANTSKPNKGNEPSLGSKNVMIQGATKKGQKQGAPEEVKIIDNENKDKKPEIKDIAQKSSESSNIVTEGTPAKRDSGPVSENKQDENLVSTKKSKSKKSKQKVTNAPSPNIPGSENTKSKTSPGGDNKEIKKSVPESKSQEKSGLLDLMQEVLDVMGKNNESGEKSESIRKDDENETKKSKKSKSRKKSKPKENSETQEKDSNVKTQVEFVKLAKADTNATTQKPESKITDNEDKNTDVQKMKHETTEDTVKNTVKSKKGKRNAGKNKEDPKQSSDKSKQNNVRSKTNQPSTADLISNATSLDELKGDGEAVIDDVKDGEPVLETSQSKKKRKRRKNKSKPSGNEEGNKVGEDKENNEATPAPEALAGVKKNSNRIKSTEKIGTGSTNEINKNIQTKQLNLKVKPEEIKEKVSGTLSGEQLNHLTQTAVNLSQSLGNTDGFDSKFTPDIMRSLLAAKPKDIFSTPEDDEEVEYRMVQRQIFLSYVCHVCKSMESKSCTLKKCNNCKLISYCSKKHQKDHWSAHKDMCTAITNICKREGLLHLFQNAFGLVPNDYRLYRTHYVNMCAQELGRELQLWEKEMIYYPQVCHTCYDCEVQKLRACQNCSHVSYCSISHRKIDHDIWCKEFQIYRDITLHQFHNGMIRPILPEKVFDENVPVTGNMETFLAKAYNITEKSVQMSKLHFVALTDVATCPFTVLFSLQNIGFPLKDADSLEVHLVGAEMFFEIDTIRKWEMLLLHLLSSIKILKIVFVGPELSVHSAVIKSLSETKVCRSCSSSGRKVIYEFWPGLYHDFMRTEMYRKPDLICAFNSGLYRPVDFGGMDTWSPTIEAIFKNSSIPVVVTEYTEQELPFDIARIQAISSSVDIVMSPTRNPFSSTKPSLNFLSEEKVPVIFKNFYICIIKSQVQ